MVNIVILLNVNAVLSSLCRTVWLIHYQGIGGEKLLIFLYSYFLFNILPKRYPPNESSLKTIGKLSKIMQRKKNRIVIIERLRSLSKFLPREDCISFSKKCLIWALLSPFDL